MGNAAVVKAKDPDETLRKKLEKSRKVMKKKWSPPIRNANNLDDFDLLKTIGVGSFSQVILVQHKNSKDYFAMKILNKQKVVELKAVKNALNEKRILHAIDFPFFVKLKYHFKDFSNLYMVYEYVPGGTLFTHLRKFYLFSEPHSRFYACQIVLAFEYLHGYDLVYRGLKPENLLIDEQGYIKITDFTFAKRVKYKTWTFCGTNEYLAPEIILNQGHSTTVDWWALGVLLFEMVAGFSPFSADDSLHTYKKIISGNVRFPLRFTHDLKDLLEKLLERDITKRYGTLKNGVNDIKNHKWFETTNWAKVLLKKVKAPLIPVLDIPTDTSQFEENLMENLKQSSTKEFAKEFAEF